MPPALRLATVCSFALAVTATGRAGAQASPTVAVLIQRLSSPDREDRREAAEELGQHGLVPPAAVGPLLNAAQVEGDVAALQQMLLTLGKSGMLEALGVLQAYARSPHDDIRASGREALQHWLVRNRVLRPDDELPDPPTPYDGAPPPFPPDRPAGHALGTWMALPPGVHPAAPTIPAPIYYRPPDADGLPAGYRSIEERPITGLIVAGGILAGLNHAFVTSTGMLFCAVDQDDVCPALIPVIGPAIVGSNDDLFHIDTNGVNPIALFLVLDTIGQASGIALMIAGGKSTTQSLVPDARMGRLTWTF